MAQLPVGEAGLSGLLRGLHPCQAETFRAPLIERASCGYAHPRLSYQDFVFLQPHSPWGLHGAESSGGFPTFSPYMYGYGSQPTATAPLLGFLFELPGFAAFFPFSLHERAFPGSLAYSVGFYQHWAHVPFQPQAPRPLSEALPVPPMASFTGGGHVRSRPRSKGLLLSSPSVNNLTSREPHFHFALDPRSYACIPPACQ